MTEILPPWTDQTESAYLHFLKEKQWEAGLAQLRGHQPTPATPRRAAALLSRLERWPEVISELTRGGRALQSHVECTILADAYLQGRERIAGEKSDVDRAAAAVLERAFAFADCPPDVFHRRYYLEPAADRRAVRHFLRLGAEQTGAAWLRSNWAWEARMAKAFEEQIEALAPVLATDEVPSDPDQAGPWLTMRWEGAQAYRTLGRDADAAALLERMAAEMTPEVEPYRLFFLGLSLLSAGREAEAVRQFELVCATDEMPGLEHLIRRARLIRAWTESSRLPGPGLADALDGAVASTGALEDWMHDEGDLVWLTASTVMEAPEFATICRTAALDDDLPISDTTCARLLAGWLQSFLANGHGWSGPRHVAEKAAAAIGTIIEVEATPETLHYWADALRALGDWAAATGVGLRGDARLVAAWRAKASNHAFETDTLTALWQQWSGEHLAPARAEEVHKAALKWWKSSANALDRGIAVRAFYTHIWRPYLVAQREYTLLGEIAETILAEGGTPEERQQASFDAGYAYHSRHPNRAIAFYRQAISLGVSTGGAINLSLLLEGLGKLTEALEVIEQMAGRTNAWPQGEQRARYLRSRIAEGHGDLDAARREIVDGLTTMPDWNGGRDRLAAIDALIAERDRPKFPRRRARAVPAPAPAASPALPSTPGTPPPALAEVLKRGKPKRTRTAGEREPMSKALRFEVFKRDGFKCQYCGHGVQDGVVLHVDHIHPVAEGGTNDLINLVTACEACNLGKAARTLDDNSAVAVARAQAERLQAIQEQTAMALAWQRGLQTLAEDAVEQVAAYFESYTPGFSLNETGRKIIKSLLRKFALSEVLQSIDIAADSYLAVDDDGHVTEESVGHALGKVRGVCQVREDSRTEPDLRDLLYIRGIVKNNVRRWHPSDGGAVIEALRDARSWDVSIAELRSIAQRQHSISDFHDAVDAAIEREQLAAYARGERY